MPASLILALDQGTTSSRAIVFDRQGQALAMAQQEFRQSYPHDGWVEHDAAEIWTSQLAVARQALHKAAVSAADIAAIGISNQRETTILWDRHSGEALAPAIVWQDRRTAAYCESLQQAGMADLVQRKTGLLLDAYFSASKLRWLLDNTPGARERAARGELAFGTVDSWLLWQLTGGKVHATDVSNAARTMLFNIHSLQWDEELLALFDIPASLLPEVRGNSGLFGHSEASCFGAPVAICGMAGDQQAALFGQQCTQQGMVKNTYGTGCFLMMNTGTQPVVSQQGLIATIAWQLDGHTSYALEGSVFIAGSAVKWLRDGLGIIRDSSEVEALAASVADSDGVYLVPAFNGLGAPYWQPQARGQLGGLTQASQRGHIARATLESIALQTYDVVQAMQLDAGVSLHELRVDGGAAVNNLLMQTQSDLLGCRVLRPQQTETTALGAAGFAGLACGLWPDQAALAKLWQAGKVFTPQMDEARRERLLGGWQAAIRQVLYQASGG